MRHKTFERLFPGVCFSGPRSGMGIQKSFLGVVVLLCSACASHPPEPEVSDDVEKALVSSAKNIENSLKMLAQAETFEKVTARGKVTRFYYIPGLQNKVSMQWDGDLESAVAALTRMSAGFVYQPAIGKRPPVAVMISLPNERRTLQDLLESAALQAANRADVVIDTKSKIIQVRYIND